MAIQRQANIPQVQGMLEPASPRPVYYGRTMHGAARIAFNSAGAVISTVCIMKWSTTSSRHI